MNLIECVFNCHSSVVAMQKVLKVLKISLIFLSKILELQLVFFGVCIYYIFIGTVRCLLMCDHLEEAAHQLAFFCEVQESFGNTAV